jgi:hypothetical protein
MGETAVTVRSLPPLRGSIASTAAAPRGDPMGETAVTVRSLLRLDGDYQEENSKQSLR